MFRRIILSLCGLLLASAAGCHHPSITAVSLNPPACDDCGGPFHHCKEGPTGIPFYLPKPLLVVAKNFRNIEETKVGLTNSAPIPNGFDDQSKYADLNARTNFSFEGSNGTTSESGGKQTAMDSAVAPANFYSPHGAPVSPGEVPSDGLAPNTFYTYHIVFVPDLSQKYGLRVKGGVGEIRAAMNLVNGWQFTGLGPYYMKDSSTAQNILAGGISTRLGGQAASDVIKSIADLAGGLQSGEGLVDAGDPRIQSLSQKIEELPHSFQPMPIPNYAEIHVFEPHLGPDGQMEWVEIVNLSFDRTYLGKVSKDVTFAPKTQAAPAGGLQSGTAAAGALGNDVSVARMAVAGVFGIPSTSPALLDQGSSGLQSGTSGGDSLPAANAAQVQLNQDFANPKASKEFNLFRFGGKAGAAGHHKPDRARVETRMATGLGALALPAAARLGAGATGAPTSGQATGLQSGSTELAPAERSPVLMNQPTLNQPVLNQPNINRTPDPLPDVQRQPVDDQPLQ
jgi:hypothetical protein